MDASFFIIKFLTLFCLMGLYLKYFEIFWNSKFFSLKLELKQFFNKFTQIHFTNNSCISKYFPNHIFISVFFYQIAILNIQISNNSMIKSLFGISDFLILIDIRHAINHIC